MIHCFRPSDAESLSLELFRVQNFSCLSIDTHALFKDHQSFDPSLLLVLSEQNFRIMGGYGNYSIDHNQYLYKLFSNNSRTLLFKISWLQNEYD